MSKVNVYRVTFYRTISEEATELIAAKDEEEALTLAANFAGEVEYDMLTDSEYTQEIETVYPGQRIGAADDHPTGKNIAWREGGDIYVGTDGGLGSIYGYRRIVLEDLPEGGV